MKQLNKYADIGVSVVRPYPKGTDGWRFNVKGEPPYEDATAEPFFGARFLHELYFKVDPDYKGKYTVPMLWDKKLNTIVNNESHELLRDLQTCFNDLLPSDLANITLYPEQQRSAIDRFEKWMQSDLNTGVYKAGFAPDQETYERNLPAPFAAMNKLEKLAASNGGPYILGKEMTELDVRAYATLVRFDTVYVQHFKCNLGTVRHDYPVLNNWLKNLYHNHPEFKVTTHFRHIKENYTKSHLDINPKMITPVGPFAIYMEGILGGTGFNLYQWTNNGPVLLESNFPNATGQGKRYLADIDANGIMDSVSEYRYEDFQGHQLFIYHPYDRSASDKYKVLYHNGHGQFTYPDSAESVIRNYIEDSLWPEAYSAEMRRMAADPEILKFKVSKVMEIGLLEYGELDLTYTTLSHKNGVKIIKVTQNSGDYSRSLKFTMVTSSGQWKIKRIE